MIAELAVLVLVLVLSGVYVSWTAGRLDRLHARVDAAWAALDAALGRVGVAGAERLGLVTAAGPGPDDAVRAQVDLRPYASDTDTAGWLTSDLGEVATGTALAPAPPPPGVRTTSGQPASPPNM